MQYLSIFLKLVEMGLFNLKTNNKDKVETYQWYEVEPSPFQLLSQEDQDRLTNNFAQLLNSVNEAVIYIKNVFDFYEYENNQYPVIITKFYFGTKETKPGFFNMKETSDPLKDRPTVTYEYPDKLMLSDGSLAKVLVAYNYPDYLPDGFLFEYYGIADEIFVKFKQVDQYKAIKMVSAARLRAESLLSGNRVTPEIERKVQKLRDLSTVIGGSAKLFEVYMYIVVRGKTDEELHEKEKKTKEIANVRLISAETPKYIQRELYEFKTSVSAFTSFSVEKNFIDSLSAQSFYPFISEDLIDEKGVFLGISGSNSPVVFNPYARNNYNIVILGETGSGKSMTTKVFLRRLRKKLSIEINGIDPENEYVKDVVAKELNITPVLIKPGQKLGLDLMKFVREGFIDATDAAELIADLYYVPQELRPRLRRLFVSSDADTIFQFVDELKESKADDLLKYLDAIESPPDSYVYDGTPISVTGNIVFGIKELRNQRLKVVVSSLLTLLLQKKMLSGRQLLFVDEAWIFSEYPAVLNLLQEVARRGRKYGDIFMYITQRPWDVYSTPEGRTILEQAATAILLRQRAAATEVLQKAYNLSQAEIDYLLSANPGQGIIRAGNYKLTLQILVTQEELQKFSTSPAI
jgi:ABC-type dipeptide/oligopeptide/nickel transport system ATPase component